MRWLRRLPWLRRGRGGEVKAPSNPLVGLVKDVREDDRGISLTGVIWSPGSGDGSDVGIVHSMSFDRAPIVAGQSGISVDSLVKGKDNRWLIGTGVALHVLDGGVVVRWPSGIVTVQDVTELELVES